MSGSTRAPRRRISGVLLIDKPLGPTSQQVVAKLKWLFNAEKVGHGGTLDPLASGLLIVGFGEATKFLQRHLEGDKTYVATMKFGAQTTTGDAEGDVVARSDVIPAAQKLAISLENFLGEIMQTPPQFSALKVDGKPAYAYARAGEAIALTPRTVRIHVLKLLDASADTATIEVTCSKGTYIRTLAEDIARAVGSVAHLTALRRIASGPMHVRDAMTMEWLVEASAEQRDNRLQPADILVSDLPILRLSADEGDALAHGRAITCASAADGVFRAYRDEREFLGLVEVTGRVAKSIRLMATLSQ